MSGFADLRFGKSPLLHQKRKHEPHGLKQILVRLAKISQGAMTLEYTRNLPRILLDGGNGASNGSTMAR